MAYKAKDIPADLLARMSDADRAAIGQGKVVMEDDRPLATWKSRYRSKLEADYAAFLAVQPDVLAWDYEAVSVVIGAACRYTPDFRVIVRGEVRPHFQMHEVKGPHRHREKGIVKLKAAAKQYPEYEWFLVTRDAEWGWQVERIVL